MAPKRRTGEALPRGAHNAMHSPPSQRAVGSPQALTPVDGFDVELPRSPVRGAATRHSQEATQPAPSTPAPMQQGTPPRLSQMPTQPMEWTPTSTKNNGTTSETPPRHSQENTQPAPPQLADLYTQYRERHNHEEELIAESLAQYQQIGEGQPAATSTDNLPQVMVTESLAQYQLTGECRMAHIIDAAQLTHTFQQHRGCRHATQPSHTTHRHARHRHTTTKHWRQMPQMGGKYPGPIPIQPNANALRARGAANSLHQANQDYNNGVVEMHNEPMCMLCASREVSRPTTSCYPRAPQTPKQETPSSV